MPRVETATILVADEKGRFDRLQHIVDSLHGGFGDWAALLAERYEGFFGTVACMAFVSPFWRKRDGVLWVFAPYLVIVKVEGMSASELSVGLREELGA